MEQESARSASIILPTPLSKRERLDDPFVVAGGHAYLIGTQDGCFPDSGWHVPGEMHGLWAHPFKLLDGFWLEVDGEWLTAAREFVGGPFWGTQLFKTGSGIAVTRLQFVPDGEPAVVIRFSVLSPLSSTVRCRLLARTDLRPVWNPFQPDGSRPSDAATYLTDQGAWVCRSHDERASVAIGAAGVHPQEYDSGTELWGPEQCAGHGISVSLTYDLHVGALEPAHLDFVVAGGAGTNARAAEVLDRVAGQIPALWDAKTARYARVMGQNDLQIPDASIQSAWSWTKCGSDWLVREVPGLGRGLGAGLPDYPWWFGCDSAYATLGCLATGQHDVAISTLDLLREISLGANGPKCRVIHECTTAGNVFDRGRANETAQFVCAVWQTYLWTGDTAFLNRNYEFCRRGMLEWTLDRHVHTPDGLPSGYGMVEIRDLDLQCVDVTVYAIAGLRALAGLADAVGDTSVALDCLARAAALTGQMEARFWLDEERMYADMLATPRQMVPRLTQWLRFAETQEWSGQAATLRRLLHDAAGAPDPDHLRAWPLAHWIAVTPLEAGLATRARAQLSLQRLNGADYTGPWGMYLNASHHGDMMTLPTGALVMANIAYGQIDHAVDLIRKVSDTLGVRTPGGLSEISPDRGCFVQAWSNYAVSWPIVHGIFGVRPDAARHHLEIAPRFPASWDQAALRNLRIGEAAFDITWSGGALRVTSSDADWNVVIDSSSNAAPEGSGTPPR